jgi:hypothetical protein
MGVKEKHFLAFVSYETSVVLPEYISLVSTLHAQWQDARRFSLSVANYEKLKRALLPSFPLFLSLLVQQSVATLPQDGCNSSLSSSHSTFYMLISIIWSHASDYT